MHGSHSIVGRTRRCWTSQVYRLFETKYYLIISFLKCFFLINVATGTKGPRFRRPTPSHKFSKVWIFTISLKENIIGKKKKGGKIRALNALSLLLPWKSLLLILPSVYFISVSSPALFIRERTHHSFYTYF